MATSVDYIEFVCQQLAGAPGLRYKKMFGEYMVYVNDKPVLLVCDNTVYVKKVAAVADALRSAAVGIPYQGAKEHYILDIEDIPLAQAVVSTLERVTPLPKKRKA